MSARLLLVGLVWLIAGGVMAAAEEKAAEEKAAAVSTESCLECHGLKDIEADLPDGGTKSVFTDVAVLRTSVHGQLDCADCHEDLTGKHPDDEIPAKPVNCASCHEEQSAEYATSIHGASRAMGDSAAASCTDCHGTHEMLSAANPNSPLFKLNLSRTCAKCHDNPGITEEYQMRYPDVASHYQDSIHGRGMREMGLVIAPSCNDCHGVHAIKRSTDRSSPIHKSHVAQTCGKCHLGIEEIYNKSIHGQLLLNGHPEGPVCTDCHTAHDIEPHGTAHFKEISDKRCGKCHQDSLTHYRDTYHGKAMALGQPNVAPDVAACYDCHGHHDILPTSDPASRLSESRIVDTCARCHAGATVGFTQYISHANPLDGEKYPLLNMTFLLMTGLLMAVFAFFGGHTLMWMARSVYLYRHDSKTYREAKVKTSKDDVWFTRFPPFERFLHFLVVVSFLLLVITGMPLKFYHTDWAKALFDMLGGAQAARAMHRFGAIITFAYFALHLGNLLITWWKNRAAIRDPETGRINLRRVFRAAFGPDSMIPTLHDWRDFVAHNKWFFGKGPKPQFDRWTYWEKFDYLAVFWGVFAIGLSGMVMWFPQFFTSFMPGWVINVALIVHSDEALLAAGFIFTIHFFNTHFRLEKFPMDNVIFSGRISKTEMLHERKRWYDRLVKEGRIEQHLVRDEWERWRRIARPIGFVFFGIGVVLLVLILYAMASRLLH